MHSGGEKEQQNDRGIISGCAEYECDCWILPSSQGRDRKLELSETLRTSGISNAAVQLQRRGLRQS